MVRSMHLAALLLAIGCGKSDAPSCETALTRAAKVIGEEISAESLATEIARCTSGKWSAQVRSCLGGARSSDQVMRCLPREKIAKRSEPDRNLDAIKKGLEAYHAENAQFPVGNSGGLVPSAPCCASGGTCAPDPGQWLGPAEMPTVWDQLGFSIDDAHHFQYAYSSDGKTATVTAVADLDCDDTQMTYTLEAIIDPEGNPVFELIKPTRVD